MKKLIIIATITFAGYGSKAQSQVETFMGGLTGGLEIGAATLKEPLISGFVGYNKPKAYFKFRISSILQDTYEVNINGEETKLPGFSEVALILGKRIKINSNHRIELGGGAAVISDLKKYDQSNSQTSRDKIVQKNSAGLIAEAKYIYRFFNGVGLSLSVNGNANRQKTFASAGLGIVLTSKDNE
ncbi:hypothetical protein [Pedobacter nototheniae]|uniref:hypothetical protein n=1 Tax=Pedobacter nototheniae TaxID=2488994 RepID=UPI002931A3B9|nr:hypothetical protein [Pedobacter nototheniae]